MKYLISAIVLIAALYASHQTPIAVKTFYTGMEQLGSAANDNRACEIEMAMKECFIGAENSGINLPNDFQHFSYDKNTISHDFKTLTSNNYVNKLKEYIYTCGKMTVQTTIGETIDYGSLPRFKSGKLSMADVCIATVIKKDYAIGNDKMSFIDTVITAISSGKISEIRNGAVAAHDVNSLRNSAAKAYRMGLYYKAYSFYEQIIKIAEQDANNHSNYSDDYYRIGLMTYFKKGYDGRDAKDKGLEYLSRAGYSTDARNALHHLKHRNQ